MTDAPQGKVLEAASKIGINDSNVAELIDVQHNERSASVTYRVRLGDGTYATVVISATNEE